MDSNNCIKKIGTNGITMGFEWSIFMGWWDVQFSMAIQFWFLSSSNFDPGNLWDSIPGKTHKQMAIYTRWATKMGTITDKSIQKSNT